MHSKFNLLLFISFCLLNCSRSVSSSNQHAKSSHPQIPDVSPSAALFSEFDEIFPIFIPEFKVRRDAYTQKQVSRGRLEKLGGPVATNGTKVTYNEFRKALQCSPTEPDLDGQRGTISMLKMLPPTRKTVELMCAWAETGCQPWHVCHEMLPTINDTVPNDSHGGFTGSPFQARLLRVINGSLYYDWPWRRYRFDDLPNYVIGPFSDVYHLLHRLVLSKISDLGDSVFFDSEEISAFPWNFPFPCLNFAPKIGNGDIPMPWRKSFYNELEMYRFGTNNGSHYDRFHAKNYSQWYKRRPTAGIYGRMTTVRQLAYDAAYQRPDLIEARFTVMQDIDGWNPLSKWVRPPGVDNGDFAGLWLNNASMIAENLGIGYVGSLVHMVGDHDIDYVARMHKYLVVMIGLNGLSTAGQIADIMIAL